MGLSREAAADEVNRSTLPESEKLDLIETLTNLEKQGEEVPLALSLAIPGQAVGLLQRARQARALVPLSRVERAQEGNDLAEKDEYLIGMEAFVKACTFSAEVKSRIISVKPGEVLDLGEGVSWFGNPQVGKHQLYNRPCYNLMMKARDEYIKQDSNLQGGCDTVITGTPGVGKSHLAALITAQRLAAGKFVLLQYVLSASEETTWWWLSPSGDVEELENLREARLKLRKEPSACYITDGAASGIDLVRFKGERLVFSSPQAAVFRGERKAYPTLVLFMPVASLPELHDIRRKCDIFKGLNPGQLDEWYDCAGGVLRTCLKEALDPTKSPELWLRDVQNILNSMSPSELLRMITLINTASFPHGSDRLFHWHPSQRSTNPSRQSPRDNVLRQYRSKLLKFASQAVGALAVLYLHVNQMVAASLACMDSRADLAAGVGYWFPYLALAHLRGGETLRCRLLVPQGRTADRLRTIQLPKLRVNFYSSLEEAREKMDNAFHTLSIPRSAGEKAVDAMVGPAVRLQLTVAGSHTLLRSAVTKANSVLLPVGDTCNKLYKEARQLVTPGFECTMPLHLFIVPSTVFNKWTHEQPYTGSYGVKGSTSQKPVVHQLVVEIPVEKILEPSDDESGKRKFMEILGELAQTDPSPYYTGMHLNPGADIPVDTFKARKTGDTEDTAMATEASGMDAGVSRETGNSR